MTLGIDRTLRRLTTGSSMYIFIYIMINFINVVICLVYILLYRKGHTYSIFRFTDPLTLFKASCKTNLIGLSHVLCYVLYVLCCSVEEFWRRVHFIA